MATKQKKPDKGKRSIRQRVKDFSIIGMLKAPRHSSNTLTQEPPHQMDSLLPEVQPTFPDLTDVE